MPRHAPRRPLHAPAGPARHPSSLAPSLQQRYNEHLVRPRRGALQPRSGQARQISCNGARPARHVRGPRQRTFRLSGANATMSAVVQDSVNPDYKIRDISLADLGRKRIRMAEEEMPGLMAIRAKYAAEKPLEGVRL